MLDDEGDHSDEESRNDAVRDLSVGQATLRRILGGPSPSGRMLTPATRGGRTPVFTRNDFPIPNVYFRNPMEAAEFCSPLGSSDGSAGDCTPEDLEREETTRKLKEDLATRTMGEEEMARFRAAGFDSRSYLEPVQTDNLNGSTYLPGDFRYLHSIHPMIQGDDEGNSISRLRVSRQSPHTPEHRSPPDLVTTEQHFDSNRWVDSSGPVVQDQRWERVRQEAETFTSRRHDASFVGSENQQELYQGLETLLYGNRNARRLGHRITIINGGLRSHLQCVRCLPPVLRTSRPCGTTALNYRGVTLPVMLWVPCRYRIAALDTYQTPGPGLPFVEKIGPEPRLQI
jgi:hypothetical protein